MMESLLEGLIHPLALCCRNNKIFTGNKRALGLLAKQHLQFKLSIVAAVRVISNSSLMWNQKMRTKYEANLYEQNIFYKYLLPTNM